MPHKSEKTILERLNQFWEDFQLPKSALVQALLGRQIWLISFRLCVLNRQKWLQIALHVNSWASFLLACYYLSQFINW